MLEYEIVDVFPPRVYAGNPLAVVFDTDELTTEQCQALANEFHLSETSFLSRPPSPAPTTGYGSSRPTPSCRSPGTRASGRPTRWCAPAA